MSEPRVFLHYSQRELDQAYDQSAWAANMAQVVARYGAESQRLRPLATVETVRYGSGPNHTLDFFRAAGGRRPVQIFVHGGAWRSGVKETYGFVGQALSARGVHCAVVDFSPADEIGLPAMVEEVAQAVSFLHDAANGLSIDRQSVTMMGHSSGAHLAACLLTGAAGQKPREIIRAAFLLGGLYDMEPVLLSWRSNYISLTYDETARLSPLRHADQVVAPVTVACGTGESPEFKRQTHAFAAALARNGKPHTAVEIEGRNHFETLLELVDGGETLQLALETASLPSSTTAR